MMRPPTRLHGSTGLDHHRPNDLNASNPRWFLYTFLNVSRHGPDMDRFASRFAWIGLLMAVGCGSPVAEKPPEDPSNQIVQPATSAPIASPTEIVSQFLDQIRRGGEDSRAGRLLTARAQSELKRIGLTVLPIGSPDAQFSVTRAESVPEEEGSVLVHCIWSEPAGDGSTSNTQVVWALQKEPIGWRISGVAMEIAPNQDPMIVDFENGTSLARIFEIPVEADKSMPSSSQAAASSQAISR